MRNFKDVYNNNKSKVNENLKIVADKERVELLSAIRKQYGVKSFNNLSESEKLQYKNLINELWNPISGLNEKGKMFLLESNLYDAYNYNSMLLPAGIYNYIEKCGINVEKLYMISNSNDEVSDISIKANDDEKKFNKFVNWFSLMKLGQSSNNKYILNKDVVYYFEYKNHKYCRWHKKGGNELLFMDIDGANYLYECYQQLLNNKKEE